MKRKTNLFYNTKEDTNFVTFSNYTESMTGNYLSTNTKIYPSRFLCLNIPSLSYYTDEANVNERLSFIHNVLCGEYENKLAVLRDYCVAYDFSCEETLKPLNYLLEAIFEYDSSTEITFVGEVTEQDYNGVYADTICNINMGEVVFGDVEFEGNYDDNIVTVSTYYNQLYGWENTTLPSEYANIKPIYDNEYATDSYVSNRYDITTDTYTYETLYTYVGDYYVNSIISGISLYTDSTTNLLTFNAIIPLYDVVNVNTANNTTILNNVGNRLDLSDNAGDWYYKNVPMGMWFAESTVNLTRQTGINNFAPSWSLVLSSQFKPFPYSQQIPDEITTDSTADAYQTFSQILIKQNEVIDKFNDVLTSLNNLSQRVTNIEGQLNTVGTSYSLDGLRLEMINWETEMNNNYSEMLENINSYMSSLTWKYRQG